MGVTEPEQNSISGHLNSVVGKFQSVPILQIVPFGKTVDEICVRSILIPFGFSARIDQRNLLQTLLNEVSKSISIETIAVL